MQQCLDIHLSAILELHVLKSSQNIGGGTGFLVKVPFCQLPCTVSSYTSFEASVITLKLCSSKLTVYNVYRPPASSNYAKTIFYFSWRISLFFLCCAATNPNEFLITGDFNIHVDDPYDSQASSLLTLLSDANLVQHVNFPTQDPGGDTLDLVITSVDSNLNPEVVRADSQPSDHYPVFSHLSISPDPLPPPQTKNFRHLHSINHTAFLNDLKQTSLVTNPPESLSHLAGLYRLARWKRLLAAVSPSSEYLYKGKAHVVYLQVTLCDPHLSA